MPDNSSIRQYYLNRLDDTQDGQKPGPKVPLGIGRLIADCFAMLFRKLPIVLVLSFWPSLLGVLLSGSLVGIRYTIGFEDVASGTASGPILLSALVDILVYAVVTALLVRPVHDVKFNRPVRISRDLVPALKSVFPISLLILAQTLMVMLGGLLALFIPGSVLFGIIGFVFIGLFLIAVIWAYAAWSVMPAAVVVEGAGFQGLSRSVALTKGYRWPIVAVIAPVWICSALVVLATAALTGLVESIAGLSAAVVLFAVADAIGTSLVGIIVSILYIRLREIKEGIGVDRVAEVFD
ncbi:hypothetical protein [Labrenzia sp. VG12]|uniref:hypothetical protein n=1 Tax=Labrenzia sp. VG12 TaxID=2021862 RepID=UPI000B8BE606|nr:hypothetical protein [Labrenzia sp. VG12]ASP34945.1 hypothetical protein CHH27_18270 [Labrenzia sp. VG12]